MDGAQDEHTRRATTVALLCSSTRQNSKSDMHQMTTFKCQKYFVYMYVKYLFCPNVGPFRSMATVFEIQGRGKSEMHQNDLSATLWL